jgi:hypothetical protein
MTTLTILSTTGRDTRNSGNAGTIPGIAFGTHIPPCTAPTTSKHKSGKTTSDKPHGSLNGDILAVSIMMKTIKMKTLLEVLLRDASG